MDSEFASLPLSGPRVRSLPGSFQAAEISSHTSSRTEAHSPRTNGSIDSFTGMSRQPRMKNHWPSIMHWSLLISARVSRSSRLKLAYMSGKSATKLRGSSSWSLAANAGFPELAHTRSSTTVAPPPPSFCGGSVTETTCGCFCRYWRRALRRMPMPLP